MPTHNHFAPNPATLVGSGPLIQVEVAIHPTLAQYLQTQGQPIPQPVVGLGLIDTGASISAVDTAVIQALLIPPVGVQQIHGVAGGNPHYKYPASFRFPATNFPAINFNFVIGANIAPQGIVPLRAYLQRRPGSVHALRIGTYSSENREGNLAPARQSSGPADPSVHPRAGSAPAR